jgi:hypothetical protein
MVAKDQRGIGQKLLNDLLLRVPVQKKVVIGPIPFFVNFPTPLRQQSAPTEEGISSAFYDLLVQN